MGYSYERQKGQEILHKSWRKPNKIRVNKDSEF